MNILSSYCLLVVLGAQYVAPCTAAAPAPTELHSLSCTSGPLPKTFGKSQWLVYACDDKRSIVIVSAPDSRAAPFYFFFFWGVDGFEIKAEETGNETATKAAFEELKLLSEANVAVLFAAAKAIPSSSTK